jgi:DNA repair exonuclease SbcCD ATPase subunit
MAFFQDLGKKITNAAQDASKKTSELIEISKLNSSINAEKSAISEVQKKIGGTVYGMFTAGEQLPASLLADVQTIAEKYQSITNLENKIAEIKAEAEKAKEEAAAQNQAAAAAAAYRAPGAAPAGTRFCTACGAPLDTGMVFCGKCGQKND